jgi:hypothetical protein
MSLFLPDLRQQAENRRHRQGTPATDHRPRTRWRRQQRQLPARPATELIAVISKYVKVNPDDIRVSLEKQGNYEVLEVNIVLPEVFVDEVDKLKGDGRPGPRHFRRERPARPAQDHGRRAGQAQGRPAHRYHAYPVHLRRRLCRARQHPDQDPHLRLHFDLAGDDQKILERLNARVKPTDLLEFGLIPEFAGRLPIVTRLHDLTQEMLVRIMTEPKNAIYQTVQGNAACRWRRPGGRADRLSPDRRTGHRVQGRRAQPARHL